MRLLPREAQFRFWIPSIDCRFESCPDRTRSGQLVLVLCGMHRGKIAFRKRSLCIGRISAPAVRACVICRHGPQAARQELCPEGISYVWFFSGQGDILIGSMQPALCKEALRFQSESIWIEKPSADEERILN